MRTIIAIVVAVTIPLAGCASIVRGSSQSIAVTSVPEGGALCEFQSESGTLTVVTPGTLTLEKSGQDIPVKCTKTGYQETVTVLPSNFDAWTIGNIFIPGGLIGIAVDASTGAMNKYPKSLQISLQPQAKVQAPTTPVASNK